MKPRRFSFDLMFPTVSSRYSVSATTESQDIWPCFEDQSKPQRRNSGFSVAYLDSAQVSGSNEIAWLLPEIDIRRNDSTIRSIIDKSCSGRICFGFDDVYIVQARDRKSHALLNFQFHGEMSGPRLVWSLWASVASRGGVIYTQCIIELTSNSISPLSVTEK